MSAAPLHVGTYAPPDLGATGRSTRSRWQRWRWPLTVLAVVILVPTAAALARPIQSTTPLAPDNPSVNGAQALSRVLDRHGVQTIYVDRVADALTEAGPGDTLLVIDDGWLIPEQIEALWDTGADLVLVAPTGTMVDTVTDGGLSIGAWHPPGVRSPECTDPDAQAIGQLHRGGPALTADSADFEVCFPVDGEPGTGIYAVGHRDGRHIRVLSDQNALTNESVLDEGNAAMGLRMLGHHPRLVWFIASARDTSVASDPGSASALLPPWTATVLLHVLLVTLVAALWRARRLGPLVGEDLPVIVPAAETTIGRGRLYRRSHSLGHAAAGLRAATAHRLALFLGRSRSTSAPDLIDAVAAATGRSGDSVATLLYGPPPANDAALLALAHELDTIESEVHHP